MTMILENYVEVSKLKLQNSSALQGGAYYVLVLRMAMRVVLLLRIVFVHVYAEFSNASS